MNMHSPLLSFILRITPARVRSELRVQAVQCSWALARSRASIRCGLRHWARQAPSTCSCVRISPGHKDGREQQWGLPTRYLVGDSATTTALHLRMGREVWAGLLEKTTIPPTCDSPQRPSAARY